MREILFRGIAKIHGTFEFGDLITSMGKIYIGNTIGNHPDDWCEVFPETVGQFTSLTDKNGVKIFEGDVVYLAGYGDYTVEYPFIELFEAFFEGDIGSIKGNIHDNPELL